MAVYDYKWETHNRKAGAGGRVEADTADDAKELVRQRVADQTNLAQGEIDQLVIEVSEVS